MLVLKFDPRTNKYSLNANGLDDLNENLLNEFNYLSKIFPSIISLQYYFNIFLLKFQLLIIEKNLPSVQKYRLNIEILTNLLTVQNINKCYHITVPKPIDTKQNLEISLTF